MAPRSDFLYASPSFLEGVSRIMDFGNTLNEYNYSQSDEEADEKALRMDWAMVGVDLRNAMKIAKSQRDEPTL
jgi:hypothetical protein